MPTSRHLQGMLHTSVRTRVVIAHKGSKVKNHHLNGSTFLQGPGSPAQPHTKTPLSVPLGQEESRAGAPSAGDGGLTCPIAQQGCSCGDEMAAGLIHTPVSVVLLCHRSLHHYAWMGCPNPWGESKANLSALHSGLCNALCGGVAILCT